MASTHSNGNTLLADTEDSLLSYSTRATQPLTSMSAEFWDHFNLELLCTIFSRKRKSQTKTNKKNPNKQTKGWDQSQQECEGPQSILNISQSVYCLKLCHSKAGKYPVGVGMTNRESGCEPVCEHFLMDECLPWKPLVSKAAKETDYQGFIINWCFKAIWRMPKKNVDTGSYCVTGQAVDHSDNTLTSVIGFNYYYSVPEP